MERRPAPVLLCVVVCLLAAHLPPVAGAARADAARVRVEESQIRVTFAAREARAALRLLNASGRAVDADLAVEVVDPSGGVRAGASVARRLAPGTNSVSVPFHFPFAELGASEQREFPWYRLRYRVGAGGVVAAEGLVSLSEAVPELFELRVVSQRRARGGASFRARVRAANPVTQRPVRGVRLDALLTFDGDTPVELRAAARTDRDGFAALDFALPRSVGDGDDDGELKVAARLGPFEQTVQAEVEIDEEPRVLLTADKSLYQPGQTAHLRALAFDASERAMAGEALTFIVFDEEHETVFRAEAETSRFGVASVDWPVPENARLGQYRAKIEMGGGRYSNDYQAVRDFRVSRYELPNFTVSAKPDRGYYLAGQRAEVEVRADYLFGQPVRGGRVRVVRQSSRRWNYSAQKYEIEEQAAVEGELDAAGRFVARLDLAEDHRELAGSSWMRFNDLDLAAYVTDPTTNRTEQRRFRLRLTREPIHVYVNEGRFRQAEGMPLAFYVSTSYADGTPAACEVSVYEVGEADNDGAREAEISARPLLSLRTNRYGVAKAVGPAVRAAEGRSHLALRFVARDAEGRRGSESEDFWLRDYYSSRGRTELRVETPKTLYRAGEPLEATITSNRPRAAVVVDASVGGRVVESRGLRLDQAGRASLVLPPREDYRNAVTLSATAVEPDDEDGDEFARGTRTVVFPRDRELKLDVKMARASYRPGEQAGVEFAVSGPDGRRATGALGVVVFDKAVEERALTEEEFAAPFGFGGALHGFLYGGGVVAGFTQRAVEQLNLSRPPPEGLEAVAELLFNGHRGWEEEDFRVETAVKFERRAKAVFEEWHAEQLRPLRAALAERYERTGEYPSDPASLAAVLGAAGLDFAALRDPWGRPYRAEFSLAGALDRLDIMSDGPDERPASGDEMTAAEFSWSYFRPIGGRIDRAAFERHARTGAFVRDLGALSEELRRGGFDLDTLRDRWGQPYRFTFEVEKTSYVVRVHSSGPDRTFARPNQHVTDDFVIWATLIDYFAGPRARADEALARAAREAGRFPRTEAALREALAPSGLRLEELRDGWGRPAYFTFTESKRYADRVSVEGRGQFDPTRPQQQTEITPVTRVVHEINAHSAGPDALPGTGDDFVLAYFTSIGAERAALDAATGPPRTPQPVVTFSGGSGAVSGTVLDPSGATVVGVLVTATHKFRDLKFEAHTDEAGAYLLRNLPSGFYLLTFDAAGFTRVVLDNVQVQSSNLTRADVTLEAAGITETVTVTAGDAKMEMLNATSAQVSKTRVEAVVLPRPQLSTPRLREFFPETLVWRPSLETDASGRARLDFKLADNITTWKLSVIASTEDGRIGTAEREFLAFQPFFAEHDPPRVLTEGDRISLPVVLRNYLERPQEVTVEMKPEGWFTLAGPARQTARVAAGEAARPVFDFRAVASITDGRQRVTALGPEASDAVEKPVTVHPDGEERTETAAALFAESGALEVRVPAEVIAGSVRSELKIYPALTAHIVEGVEAVMRRPYGCGEQTISSAYPSVLVLEFYRRTRGDAALDAAPAQLPAVARRAERYARLGYERLLNYRAPGGGFTYWGRGEPDFALTAYALRFLVDASRVIEVDGSVIAETRDWLVRRQQQDGSWPAPHWGDDDGGRRTALQTAFIARSLAAIGDGTRAGTAATAQGAAARPDPTPTPQATPTTAAATPAPEKGATPLSRALGYLAVRAAEIDEPYLIASYALAAADAGDGAGAARAVERLRALARDEGTGTYWSIETNTPFYGWGRAGRIETTALAVQALARVRPTGPAAAESHDTARAQAREAGGAKLRDAKALTQRGLLFLLDNKDGHGAWLSTQATVNVFGALLELVAGEGPGRAAAANAGGGRAEIFVNGRRAGDVQLPPAGELSAPVAFDLTAFVGVGTNRVEVRRPLPAAPAQAQIVTAYYVPWSGRPAAREGRADDESKAQVGSGTASRGTNGAGSANGANGSDGTGGADGAGTDTTNSGATDRGRAARDNASSSLRLSVAFDDLSAAVNQEVTCSVVAERVGHRGYGMMLAEVGLPPGSDVDRASLERAMRESGWAVSRYEIQPDRVVLYLWPAAGGVRLAFKFRPRYGLDALTAPSQLYDYYNPDARAVLAPARFVVR
ncbi:MAG TPA: alpha-2-macroglobulin family protein [Pyrinomonadaceae bacterium]|nr:alpha-2-macroglobulin family protein [Pyrinomonadaceae bacterium]